MKTTAEKLIIITRTLPEPLLEELLDFAEFLKRKNERESVTARGNFARHLHKRYEGIEIEDLPIPPRTTTRTPPDFRSS
ncbi:DUF2281 domain-containing protein [Prosthecochloris sp. N3]|uniref:DUF2281 domain-containing protein n=1 Tax=Prosthecochloris ethylica TaxID=2743976 RepID=A0ABR9XV65_9CHLB|nr:DUF2281 domain-containing protein [Prosthecochloris ethylica]MBF0587419.1 DUF2281 domain-containing protein [Prosthecochloris ethylica]MBF0637727.1 DUF2281 domain-containing protein [Prosthecochloris ethylica]NUK48596.1 DUF2281 domain-containing protein [Prosthecochloris ethylica]